MGESGGERKGVKEWRGERRGESGAPTFQKPTPPLPFFTQSALAPGGAFLHVFNTGTSDELVADGKAAAEAGGWTWVGPTLVEEDGATLAKVAGWIDAGKLSVDVAAVLPLEQAGEAHARLEGLHVRGKMVLKVGEEEQ